MSDPQAPSIHRRQTLNSLSNLGRYLLSVAIAFLLTPFIVRTLGDSLYGFWVLVISFIGYSGILEMGVQPAVVKLVGQYRAIGDHDTLEELINAALVYFGLAGLLAGLFCLTVVPRFVLNHVEDLRVLLEMRWIFPLIALDALLGFFNYLVTGILYGSQRYQLRNSIDVVGWIVNAALVIWLLPRHGLIALVGSRLFTNALIVGIAAIAARQTLEGVHFRPSRLRASSFRQLIGFGGRVFLSATTTRLANHSQPVIISKAISSAATAYYAIPVKLVDYTRQLGWALTGSLMPLFSELESRREHALLRTLYLDYSRYFLLLLLPIVTLVFVYGLPFIAIWIGPEYRERGQLVLMLLTAAALADNIQPLLWRFFIGIGRLDTLVRISAITAVLMVLAALLLVRPFGLGGVAGSVLVGSITAQTLFALDSCRYLEISPFTLFQRVQLRPLLAAGLLYGVARALEAGLGSSSYPSMLLGVVLALLVYAPLALALGLNAPERSRLVAWIRRRVG